MDLPNVYFLGLTTGNSAAHRAFPGWVQAIDWGASLIGVDMAHEGTCERYVEFLASMRADRLCAGSQVTAHKVRIYECAADALDKIEPDAGALGEVGAIAAAEGRLVGFSPDMLALGGELGSILARINAYSPRQVVILGGGGAGRAVALASARLGSSVISKITITEENDDLKGDLAVRLKALLSASEWTDIEIRDGEDNDEVVAASTPGSLIVNATGMGKDTPGSPISINTEFPRESVAWDLNYRGDLKFLRYAASQQESRNVIALDGWDYFLRNWFACLTRLASRTPSAERFERFRRASDFIRPLAAF